MTVDLADPLKVILRGLVFPESPRWHDGKLWLVDMHAHKVLTVDLDGRSGTVGDYDDRPSAVGFLPGGEPIVVLARKRVILRLGPAGPAVHADLSNVPGDNFNDMVVDGIGRIYLDNRREAQPGTDGIVLVTPEGDAREVAKNFHSPNGLVVTPDGGTLIAAEARRHRFVAFDIERDGSLAGQREFARTTASAEPKEGRDPTPDGICLDAGGGIWFGSPRTFEFLRIDRTGEFTHRIGLPRGHRAVACALGGRDRRTLCMVMAETTDENLRRCRGNFEAEKTSTSVGWVAVVRVDLPGVGWP
jgi:sugar lactone lactonase YvrE